MVPQELWEGDGCCFTSVPSPALDSSLKAGGSRLSSLEGVCLPVWSLRNPFCSEHLLRENLQTKK